MPIGVCGEENCDWEGYPEYDDDSELYLCPYCMVECWTFETWEEAHKFFKKEVIS